MHACKDLSKCAQLIHIRTNVGMGHTSLHHLMSSPDIQDTGGLSHVRGECAVCIYVCVCVYVCVHAYVHVPYMWMLVTWTR